MSDYLRTRMTATEFAKLPETNTPTELLNGELIVSPSPVASHQRIVIKLIKLLGNLPIGGEILSAPMDVYLDETNIVQPDVFWVSGEKSLCQLGDDDYWHGPPDLVAEVLSPSTAQQDKTVKFRLYEKYGVREYWIFDPVYRLVDVWTLVEGKFMQHGIYGSNNVFDSTVLNKKINLKTIFQD